MSLNDAVNVMREIPMFREVDPKRHLGRINWMTFAYEFVTQRTCSAESPRS